MKVKITDKIKRIRSWEDDKKQAILLEVERICKDTNLGTVKCSAGLSQLSESALQFKKTGLGVQEAKAIMWASNPS